MRKLFNDESGFVLSAELVVIATLVFCGVVVGLAQVRDALVQELGDVAEMVGTIDQSYSYRSISSESHVANTDHATCSGSGFQDEADDCDCKGITFTVVCGKEDPSSTNADEDAN